MKSSGGWRSDISHRLKISIYYLIKQYYRLLLSARSPLVGHINSSLEGLTTIRAFKAEQILQNEFDKYQDLYTSAFMTVRVSMFGFGFFMDFFNSLFTVIIIARFLFFETSKHNGLMKIGEYLYN